MRLGPALVTLRAHVKHLSRSSFLGAEWRALAGPYLPAFLSVDTPGGERTSVGEAEVEGRGVCGVAETAGGFRFTAAGPARGQRGFLDAYPQIPAPPPPPPVHPFRPKPNLHLPQPPTDTFHTCEEEFESQSHQV